MSRPSLGIRVMKGERYLRVLRHALGLLLLPIASVSATLGVIELLLRRNVIPNEYYERNQVLGDTGDGPFLFIIGDSFMAPLKGGDLADNLYDALAPHGVRIRNTATAGYGPVQYFESLRREGPRYRPDVVLLSYYVGNDLLDVGCGGYLDDRLRPPPPTPAWKKTYTAQYLRERLQARFPGRVIFQSALPGLPSLRLMEPTLVRLLAHALRVQKVDYDQLKKAGIPDEYIESAKAGKLNPWIMSLGVRHPNYYRDELLIRSDCAQKAWEDTKRVLDLILAEAAKFGARVFPVIFPHTFQVDTAHYALYRAWKINVDDEMLRTSRPQQLLREYFQSHGLEPFDLLDAFRNRGEMLYWDQDEHLSTRGQQFSAKLIAEAFLARYGDSAKVRKTAGRNGPQAPPASRVSITW